MKGEKMKNVLRKAPAQFAVSPIGLRVEAKMNISIIRLTASRMITGDPWRIITDDNFSYTKGGIEYKFKNGEQIMIAQSDMDLVTKITQVIQDLLIQDIVIHFTVKNCPDTVFATLSPLFMIASCACCQRLRARQIITEALC